MMKLRHTLTEQTQKPDHSMTIFFERPLLCTHCPCTVTATEFRVHHLNEVINFYRFFYRLITDFFYHFNKSCKTDYVLIFAFMPTYVA
jgi:hypothetical protein